MKKKLLFLIVPILIIMLGVTYAFFSFENFGDSSEVITGQMYLKYANNSNKLKLSNIFPETEKKALARTDNVISFTIRGKNTHKERDVSYTIGITYGDEITGKTRVKPEDIRVRLEKNGNVVVDGITYRDWQEQTIWNEGVDADTTDEIINNYTLRVWIDEDVLISDSNPKADYTTDVWNNSYISLKVVVKGELGKLETPATCFTYNVVQDITDAVAYNALALTIDNTQEKIDQCKASTTSLLANGADVSTDQDGYQKFCEGTGTASMDGMQVDLPMFLKLLLMDAPADTPKEDLYAEIMGVFPNITSIKEQPTVYELGNSEEGITACMSLFMNMSGSDASEEQDGYRSFCEGTGKMEGMTITETFNAAMAMEEVGPEIEVYFGILASSKTFVPVASADISYDYLSVTMDKSEENITACKATFTDMGGDLSTEQDGYQKFCEGTGTMNIEGKVLTLSSFFKYLMLMNSATIDELKEMIATLPFSISVDEEERFLELNGDDEEAVNSCKNVMMSFFQTDATTEQDGYESFCKGTGSIEGMTITNLFTLAADTPVSSDTADVHLFIYQLVESNIVTIAEGIRGIEISGYDETCGSKVIFPLYIEETPVRRIASRSAGNGVFEGKNISSVTFPETMKRIGANAFLGNNMTEVIVPSNIIIIEDGAFYSASLTKVTIEGNPALGATVFKAPQTFSYGGTCEELNGYTGVFETIPTTIITSDNSTCPYTGS